MKLQVAERAYRRISKDGFAELSLLSKRQNTFLRHSTFIIRYSLFQSFYSDQTGRSAAGGWDDT